MAQTKISDFSFTEVDNEIKIKKYKGNSETVEFPEVIRNKQVTIILAAFDIDGLGCLKENGPKRIVLPDSAKHLIGTFTHCNQLEEIYIPENVEEIDDKCFLGCLSLKSITVSPKNKHFMSRDGVLYSKDGKVLIRCPSEYHFDNYDCFLGVSEIASDAFSDCINLKELNISENIKVIKCGAFSRCNSLEIVRLHENVSMEGNGHFWQCKALKSIDYYNQLGEIPFAEFYCCINLETVKIYSKLKKIGENAFFNCSLNELVVPKGVKTISSAAFFGCSKLKRITLPRSISFFGKRNPFTSCGHELISEEEKNKLGLSFHSKVFTEFVVESGSKSEAYCQANGYKYILNTEN